MHLTNKSKTLIFKKYECQSEISLLMNHSFRLFRVVFIIKRQTIKKQVNVSFSM